MSLSVHGRAIYYRCAKILLSMGDGMECTKSELHALRTVAVNYCGLIPPRHGLHSLKVVCEAIAKTFELDAVIDALK